jgi:hypothetical protein
MLVEREFAPFGDEKGQWGKLRVPGFALLTRGYAHFLPSGEEMDNGAKYRFNET